MGKAKKKKQTSKTVAAIEFCECPSVQRSKAPIRNSKIKKAKFARVAPHEKKSLPAGKPPKLRKKLKTDTKMLHKAAVSAVMDAINEADVGMASGANIYKLRANKRGIKNTKRFLTKKNKIELKINAKVKKNTRLRISKDVNPTTSKKVRNQAMKDKETKSGMTNNQKRKTKPIKSGGLKGRKNIKSRKPSITKMLKLAIESAKSTRYQVFSFYKIKKFCFEKYDMQKEEICKNKDVIRDVLCKYEKEGKIVRLSGRGLIGSFSFYKKARFPRKANRPKKYKRV